MTETTSLIGTCEECGLAIEWNGERWQVCEDGATVCAARNGRGHKVDYATACKIATTDQGFDPLIAAFEKANVPMTVEQTGGFTMVAYVYAKDGWQLAAVSGGENDCYDFSVYENEERSMYGEGEHFHDWSAEAFAYLAGMWLDIHGGPARTLESVDVDWLTVGVLRDKLAGLPENMPVVIASDGWYDNIGNVTIPSDSYDRDGYCAVTFTKNGIPFDVRFQL